MILKWVENWLHIIRDKFLSGFSMQGLKYRKQLKGSVEGRLMYLFRCNFSSCSESTEIQYGMLTLFVLKKCPCAFFPRAGKQGFKHTLEIFMHWLILSIFRDEAGAVDFKHLMSMGYQRDWFQDLKMQKTARNAQRKVCARRLTLSLYNNTFKDLSCGCCARHTVHLNNNVKCLILHRRSCKRMMRRGLHKWGTLSPWGTLLRAILIYRPLSTTLHILTLSLLRVINVKFPLQPQ